MGTNTLTFELVRCITVVHFGLRVSGNYFFDFLQKQLEFFNCDGGFNSSFSHLGDHLFEELAAVRPLHQRKNKENFIKKLQEIGVY